MKNWMVLIVDALTPSLLFVLCAVANLTVVTSDPCSPAGKSIHATSGHISSPNFPNNYDANRICTWNITVPGGKTIKLTFLNFTLVAGENDDCGGAEADSARVFITNVASHGGKPNDFKICGQKLPPPVYSEGHFIQVRFESRTGLVNKGFNAIFQAIDGDSLCPTDMILDETSGSFSSPYNPRNYPFNQTCSWKIIGKQGYRVELTIPDYNLERCDAAACSCDYMEVQSSFSDQVLPRKLCGTPMHIPVKFYSLHESLRVLFVSDDTNMDYDGFGATYKLLNYSPPICPKEAILLSGSGKISSTNYPKSNYTASINCTWNITAPADKIVNFTFTDFVLSECSGNGCLDSCPYVELYDGGSTSSPSLGRFCLGSSWNEPQLSNGSQMFVMFHPGQTVNRGFEAKYESTTTGVPAAIVAMDNHTVVKNGTIELYCNVFGTPPPTVLWTHVKSGETWNQKKWTISDIQVEELGEYRCNASNKYGGDIKSTFILYEGGFCEKQCTDGKLCLKFGARYFCICPEGKRGKKCEKTDTPKKDFDVGLKLKGEFKQEYENLENPETKTLVKKIEKNVMEEFKGTGLASAKVLKLRQGSIIADLKLTFNDSVGESSVNALLTQAANRGKIGDMEVEEISVGKTFSEPTTTSVPPEDCGTFFEGEDCKKAKPGLIVLCVIGGVAVLAIIVAIIAYGLHKKKSNVASFSNGNYTPRAAPDGTAGSAERTLQGNNYGNVNSGYEYDKTNGQDHSTEMVTFKGTNPAQTPGIAINDSSMTKKAQPGEGMYADLGEFYQKAPAPPTTPVKMPPEYETTEYAEISQFLRGPVKTDEEKEDESNNDGNSSPDKDSSPDKGEDPSPDMGDAGDRNSSGPVEFLVDI